MSDIQLEISIDVMTLFPEMCDAVLSQSIIGRAITRGILSVETHQIRDFTLNRQKQVDDYPYGGGKGMIMNAQPIMDCYQHIAGLNRTLDKPYTIYMSPKGNVLTQQKAIDLSKCKHLCILCGHYEGVDQRVIDEIVDEEISVGDYVLTGGELPALVLIDSVARMLPGVLADQSCFTEESHFSGLLEHPHYTRPEVWKGKTAPTVLLSGHHSNIDKWRREQSIKVTVNRRPDMIKKLLFEKGTSDLSAQDIKFIVDIINNDEK